MIKIIIAILYGIMGAISGISILRNRRVDEINFISWIIVLILLYISAFIIDWYVFS